MFGALGVLLCTLLGVAIVTRVRQNESGDSLETHDRPTCWCCWTRCGGGSRAERGGRDLQRTLATLQASSSNDQAAIENAQARLAALYQS